MADFWTLKATPDTRIALQDAKPGDQLNVMVFSDRGFEDVDIEQLKAAGAKVQSATRRIVSLGIVAERVLGLAKLDSVSQIQLAEALRDE